MAEPVLKKLKTAVAEYEETIKPGKNQFLEQSGLPEVDNLRINKIQAMLYPQLLIDEYPATATTRQTVDTCRRAISDVIAQKDDRLVVIVGPCSIHDPAGALEYATRLKAEAERHQSDLIIVMRVYFEKPRTTVGWKGLINDPYLDESFRVNTGLRVARKLLQDLNELGVPVGCEFLDTMTPQYIADLVSWAAIGARTTECQLHRELASGLSMPVGFKNGTCGDIGMAVDAVVAARHSHCFFSCTKQGNIAIVHSNGNEDAHIILRGGKSGPNYFAESVAECAEKLAAKHIPAKLVIDVSHGNSGKDFRRQPIALQTVADQVRAGSRSILGVMIESNLVEGSQPPPCVLPGERHSITTGNGLPEKVPMLDKLKYGCSITDGCVGWSDTVEMLNNLASAVRANRASSRRVDGFA